MVSKEQVGSIENLVRTLNPAAKILRTTYSKVDLKELLSTPYVFLSHQIDLAPDMDGFSLF
jgi:G3E family GTPase